MRRIFLTIAVVVLASFAVVNVSSMAGAAKPKVTGTLEYCTKVSGNIHTTVTFSGKNCKAKAPHGYGNLTVPGIDLFSGAPFQWSNGDYVELDSPTSSGNSGQAWCPRNWTLNYSDGPVSGTSGDAYDAAVANDTYNIDICVNNRSGNVKFKKVNKGLPGPLVFVSGG